MKWKLLFRVLLGIYRDDGNENGNYCIAYSGYIGIMAKKMETM